MNIVGNAYDQGLSGGQGGWSQESRYKEAVVLMVSTLPAPKGQSSCLLSSLKLLI